MGQRRANLRESAWETYWEAGYTVHGATPVIVNRHCRSEGVAQREAEAAASTDVERLIQVGIAAEVSLWTKKWRTRRVEDHEEPRTFKALPVPRRTEPRELDLTEQRIPKLESLRSDKARPEESRE